MPVHYSRQAAQAGARKIPSTSSWIDKLNKHNRSSCDDARIERTLNPMEKAVVAVAVVVAGAEAARSAGVEAAQVLAAADWSDA